MPANVSTNYTFSMDSDDGAQLYINKTLLIDKSGAWARRSSRFPGRRVCPLEMQSITLRLPTSASGLLRLHVRTSLKRCCAALQPRVGAIRARQCWTHRSVMACCLHDHGAEPVGIHGFTGYKSGTLPLAPGSYAIEINYMQVRMAAKDSSLRCRPCASPMSSVQPTADGLAAHLTTVELSRLPSQRAGHGGSWHRPQRRLPWHGHNGRAVGLVFVRADARAPATCVSAAAISTADSEAESPAAGQPSAWPTSTPTASAEPCASLASAAEPCSSKPGTPEPSASLAVATQSCPTQPVSAESLATQPAPSLALASKPDATEPGTSQPITAQSISAEPLHRRHPRLQVHHRPVHPHRVRPTTRHQPCTDFASPTNYRSEPAHRNFSRAVATCAVAAVRVAAAAGPSIIKPTCSKPAIGEPASADLVAASFCGNKSAATGSAA